MKPFGNSNGQREKKSFKDKLINMCVDLSKNSQNVIHNFLLYVNNNIYNTKKYDVCMF